MHFHRVIIFLCVFFLLFGAAAVIQNVLAETSSKTQVDDILVNSPALFTTPGKVNTLISLNDGRMLLGGSFISVDGSSAPHSLAVIHSDGSLDTDFRADPRLRVSEVYASALQPDGKIVIAGWFSVDPTPAVFFLLRLHPDGSIDDAFTAKAHTINGKVFALLSDGNKILIGGNFTSPTAYVARLNQDGSVDPAFDGLGTGLDDIVRGIARQSTGKYILVGDFQKVDSVSQVGVVRLDTDGSFDGSFAPGGFRVSKEVAVLSDDSVLVGGDNVCGDGSFAWYTSEGGLKPALDPNPDILQSITAFLPLPDGGFLIGGWSSYLCVNGSPTEHAGEIWRYASDGSYHTMTSFGSETDMLSLALRSDGLGMIGGQGRPENASNVGLFDGLALLELSDDGLEKVDGFHPVVGDQAEITSLSWYPDGKLLVAGNFSHANGLPRFGLARLDASGRLDNNFAPFADQPGGWSNAALALSGDRALAGFGHSNLYLIQPDDSLMDLSAINEFDRVSALALQSDGKVLVGSDFGLGVRRLKSDLSGIDETFTPGDAYGSVYALAVQDDGRILVAGDFDRYNNFSVPGLVRLTKNGNIDGTFHPPDFTVTVYLAATLYSLTPLQNDAVLVGGDFTRIDGDVYQSLARLNKNGSHDTSFSSPTAFDTVKSTCLQTDGSFWVGGVADTYSGEPLLAHLQSDGVQDLALQSSYQAAHDGGSVDALVCDSSGLRWTAGVFSQINGRPFYSLARYSRLQNPVYVPLVVR